MRPLAGSIANCTFEPPVSTPISRRHAIEALRMIWYSLSVSVSAGATVTESPVWMPIGSTFSIEHYLHLVLFPAQHRFLDQHLGGGRGLETALHDVEEFVAVVGDAAAGAA